MPCQLSRDFTEEVSEYEDVLLVRLGRGSAMQLRIQPDEAGVLFRIVPIAKATQVKDESPWQLASDLQLRAWLHPASAIGRWLLAKGVDGEKLARHFDEDAPRITSRTERRFLLALRSKSSPSLP
jgi:hypothetical protein